ncbi:hypothetical protein [Isoalcanivorax indicus]|uniref:hypothetical protein n=1 Tax=Isoalcanivorax indicus TaxID=2202653 RepID=UPI000DBA91AC|nr:hypothetical protein [Isoalcanivorax indicus]
MSSEFVYTALLDVLSYRNRLNQDVQSGKESFKDDLVQSLSIFNTVNNAIFSVQAISDTVIITCNNHDRFVEFIALLKKVFISFMERGLFIRGGVAYSKHFHSGRITYSHAVARAYELESKEAIYPRIVIDKNILDMYVAGRGLPKIFDEGFLVKQNGIVFLNIADPKNWDKVYGMAREIYLRDIAELDGNEVAFQKHSWFEQYLFSCDCASQGFDRYIPMPELI